MAVTFIKSGDLHVKRTDQELILKKGVIHSSELTIDLENSAETFLNMLEELISGNEVTVERNHIYYQDFVTLYNYGFITCSLNKTKNILFLVENNISTEQLNNAFTSITAEKRNAYISDEDIKNIQSSTEFVKEKELLNKFINCFKSYDYIYYLASLNSLYKIRAINKLMLMVQKPFFLGLADNENIFITGINPKITGCFECFEKKILAKLDFREIHVPNEQGSISHSELFLMASILQKNIEQTEVNGMSQLMGNVLYFYLPNFEYSFDFNRRTILCNTCAGLNQIHFEEQNVRSINILKEFEHI
ncbi:hypothetical protein [Fervidibacillus albus]|uniref:Bacteriocin biosynthesis cyclodehydratase domain-containing protein n=1 Tax=Fervidibacillus albus TaxID=2980026 RepID=A0A9E8LT59_9BACI|nr:hypothetical protein [Fervidibacillus albus]WAA09139.1 hypothetical protein OE104_11150 [Fervidibacillus albus]